MWKAYSVGYLRNNKQGNKFVALISFLASLFLSFIGCLFYNLLTDHIRQVNTASGNSQAELTPVIVATTIVFLAASFSLILMIPHAFEVTMTSRVRQMGILESIGATPGQIKRALINEIAVLSLPAVIAGNTAGILLCGALMSVIIKMTASFRKYALSFSFSPFIFIGSVLFSLFTVLISSRIPAGKIGRIGILEAIKYTGEPAVRRVKKYRFFQNFGIYGELARKSLYVRRKAMRLGTVSVFLAVFSCVSLLNMLGISNLSTQKTYFDRFKNNWDFIVTSNDGGHSEDFLREIRDAENVKSVIRHKIVTYSSFVEKGYLSGEVKEIGLENLNKSFVADEKGSYSIDIPVFVLDDGSFEEYRGKDAKSNVIAVNIIWDSVNSERTDRQYIPLLDNNGEIPLNVGGKEILISAFSQNLPVLREELKQYSLTLVMPESYYNSLGLDSSGHKTTYTIKLIDTDKYEDTEKRLQKLLESYPDYEFEGRVEEYRNELKIQTGLRTFVYICAGFLAFIGLVNIFASTLGRVQRRSREFAGYFSQGMTLKGAAKILAWEAAIVSLRPILFTIAVNIPLMALMLRVGGISAGEFVRERLPLFPSVALFSAVIAVVALAYFISGKKICNMNIIETIKNDAL